MSTRQTIGRNIAALVEMRGTTQSAIAAVSKATKGAVSQWVSGNNRPKDVYLERICEYYSVSMDDLVGEQNGLYAKLHGLGDAPPGAFKPFAKPSTPVRVLGAAYAGDPDEPPLFDGEAMLYESLAAEHPNCFALEVIGSCMDKVFTDADHIFVDPDMEPTDGSIAVMLVDGKVEARRFRRGNDSVMLVSESHDPRPDIVLRDGEDVVCQGVVFWWQAKHGTA